MIDAAIDRLIKAYKNAGLPPIRKPDRGVKSVLAEIRREIAPLQLPAELETFWRRVDPASISVAPGPRLTDPAFALRCWKEHRDEFPDTCPRLLPICYESWVLLSIELVDGRESGGACYRWTLDGGSFRLHFLSITAYLDLLATMVELGEFTGYDAADRFPRGYIDEDRWSDAVAVRLASAQLPPRYDGLREIPNDARRWPERWQLSSGLTPDTRQPRGANTTVAGLLRHAGSGVAASGTICARVVSLAGSGAGCRITVDDGTDSLDVWCPSAVCTYGPVMGQEFEFDVVVAPNPSDPPDIDGDYHDAVQRALAGDIKGAAEAGKNLYANLFETAGTAEATAIRPVD